MYIDPHYYCMDNLHKEDKGEILSEALAVEEVIDMACNNFEEYDIPKEVSAKDYELCIEHFRSILRHEAYSYFRGVICSNIDAYEADEIPKVEKFSRFPFDDEDYEEEWSAIEALEAFRNEW